ncbi:manganese efflux pump [bacterium]|nr:manganese efflux pump [bacterium]
MSLTALIFLAIALSIDACVVSFAHGLIMEQNRFKNSLLLASFTGFFQALMPLIGYFVTQSLFKFIEPVGKWLVFAIFMYLGLKIIQEAFENDREVPTCLSLSCLFAVAIATSIDALAAGVTLSLTSTNIFKSIILIGATTFFFALAGYWAGCCLKRFPTKFLEIFAGLILIFLSIKSLL